MQNFFYFCSLYFSFSLSLPAPFLSLLPPLYLSSPSLLTLSLPLPPFSLSLSLCICVCVCVCAHMYIKHTHNLLCNWISTSSSNVFNTWLFLTYTVHSENERSCTQKSTLALAWSNNTNLRGKERAFLWSLCALNFMDPIYDLI